MKSVHAVLKQRSVKGGTLEAGLTLLSLCCLGRDTDVQAAAAHAEGARMFWASWTDWVFVIVHSVLLFWVNETTALWELSFPLPRARFRQFSQTFLHLQALLHCYFSVRSLFGFHMSLKEKEKQPSFNAAITPSYFFPPISFST